MNPGRSLCTLALAVVLGAGAAVAAGDTKGNDLKSAKEPVGKAVDRTREQPARP